MHEYVTLGIAVSAPLVAVMFGVLLSQRGLDRLEARMDERFNRLEARMDRMDANITRLLETLASHDARSPC